MKLIVQLWINFLFPHFFGIGEGPSSQENQQYGALGNIGSFATSTGEADISQASDFWRAIMSGDPNQLSKVLGPEYSAISKRGGQELKTLSEFGTRSGGTAAAGQQVGDTMRAEAGNLEGSLVASAGTNLGNLGTGLLSTGLTAHESAFSAAKTIQEQKQAKLNDIFKSIADVGMAVATHGQSLFASGGQIGGGGGSTGGLDPDTLEWADQVATTPDTPYAGGMNLPAGSFTSGLPF